MANRRRPVSRRAVVGLLGTATGLALAGRSGGATAGSARPLDSNRWLERRVLNFAHQGGALEAPSDTLFALKRARALGADVLEIDVHATADGEVVLIHDTTVDRTTDGSGRVDEHTLAALKELDAAYWFVEGCGACRDRPPGKYEHRGYATGDRQIPPGLAERTGLAGLEPNDFTVPTLREVLETFPDTFLNVEIKRTAPETEPYEREVARLLREYDRVHDVAVVSFHDRAIERFKAHAPAVDTATATARTAAFWGSSQAALPGGPNPRYEAVQVPIEYEGVRVVTEDFVQDAHDNDLAVHVWTIDDPATMRWLVDVGVDGIMTDRPTVLRAVLDELGVAYE